MTHFKKNCQFIINYCNYDNSFSLRDIMLATSQEFIEMKMALANAELRSEQVNILHKFQTSLNIEQAMCLFDWPNELLFIG